MKLSVPVPDIHTHINIYLYVCVCYVDLTSVLSDTRIAVPFLGIHLFHSFWNTFVYPVVSIFGGMFLEAA